MNMRNLIDLFEAPVQGVTGEKLAQTSGGQFMTRADRTNQAKVDAALGPGFKAGSAAANLALAKKFSQPAPAQDQPQAQAPTVSDRAATDTNVAGATKTTNQAAAVPASQALSPGEEIVDPSPASPEPYGGAAANAMAAKSSPAVEPAAAADATPSPAQQNTSAPARQGGYAQSATAATNDPQPVSDYQPVAGTTNVVSRTADKIAADNKSGNPYGQQNTATKSYDSFGDFASAIGNKVKGMFGSNQPAPTVANAASAMASKSSPVPKELEEMIRLSGMAVNEKAPPTAKGERTVKHIKQGYAKDGKLTKKEKSIAYATAWKQHNKDKVTEDIMLDEGGNALKHITNRFKHEVKSFMNTGNMAENLYDALYDYYLDTGEMPYGIAKAREGDPYQWVEERFYADMGSGMSESTVAEPDNTLSELARLAGLSEAKITECGDMNMDQRDSFNVSTNMSSDGTRNVTISAQGDKADELLSMLKLAGMDSSENRPAMVVVSSDDEEMMEADRETNYSNTPEEEYQTVDSIIHQGNDLNREKRQYADKPKLGDNPMAEDILDSELNDILESILIRDNKDDTNITKDPATGRVRATFPPPSASKAPDQSKLPLPTNAADDRVGGPRHITVGGNNEKEVDEGVFDDVSNFVGDVVGTEASKLRQSQQLRDLDAMRKQYKPGTPEHDQVSKRYDTHLERLRQDKGEVVDKAGEPIKVLPPGQWKGN